MAKPKKAAKPKKTRAAKPAATVETLNDDQLQTLFFSHKKKCKALLASFKAAKEAMREGFKLAKTEGVTRKEIELALSLETEVGEAKVQADAARIYRVAKWMGVPIGAQPDLFETSADDAVFADGRRAALSDEPRKPPEHLAQADAQRWMDGHDEGRTALNESRARQFQPLGDAAPTMTQ